MVARHDAATTSRGTSTDKLTTKHASASTNKTHAKNPTTHAQQQELHDMPQYCHHCGSRRRLECFLVGCRIARCSWARCGFHCCSCHCTEARRGPVMEYSDQVSLCFSPRAGYMKHMRLSKDDPDGLYVCCFRNAEVLHGSINIPGSTEDLPRVPFWPFGDRQRLVAGLRIMW